MTWSIAISILGVFGTIIAPIIAIKYSHYRERKDYFDISLNRAKALTRTNWKGCFQLDEKEDVVFSFSYAKKKVKGEAHYTPSSGPTKIFIVGGFYTDSLLKLDYKNSEEYKLHFGTMILKLNSDGTKLDGGVIVHGRDPDKIYMGTVTLEAT